jgi:hypothetical protein
MLLSWWREAAPKDAALSALGVSAVNACSRWWLRNVGGNHIPADHAPPPTRFIPLSARASDGSSASARR